MFTEEVYVETSVALSLEKTAANPKIAEEILKGNQEEKQTD